MFIGDISSQLTISETVQFSNNDDLHYTYEPFISQTPCRCVKTVNRVLSRSVGINHFDAYGLSDFQQQQKLIS